MTTTLTDFQRNFSALRARAEQGESIICEKNGVKYVFMKWPEDTNPFEGIEHLFQEQPPQKQSRKLAPNGKSRKNNHR